MPVVSTPLVRSEDAVDRGRRRRSAPRRTQAERRETTRAALVAATVECLVERGWSGTTTAEVQARAGLSRGALTHHFSSKAELLLAAVEDLYARMVDDVCARSAGLPSGAARLRPALELLWSTYDGPLFTASLELWAAARVDDDLRAAVLAHERRLGAELRDLVRTVAGEPLPVDDVAQAALDTVLTSMRGQALRYWLRPDAPRDVPVDRWERLLRAVLRPSQDAVTTG